MKSEIVYAVVDRELCKSFTVLCLLACLDTDNRSGYGFMGIWRYQHVCACAYVHVGVSCTYRAQLQAHPAMLASYPGSECMMEKLEVILHVGDTVVVKLWRFDSSKIVEYRGSYAKLLVFFPDVQKKGLRLEMKTNLSAIARLQIKTILHSVN